MPWFLRKSLSIGPVRFNLSKNGIGTSVGVTGFRVGVRPNGRSYVHAGRYGLYCREELGNISEKEQLEQRRPQEVLPDTNTTRYESASSKDLFPSSHKELLEKLNQSYKSFRIDYLAGLASLFFTIWMFTYNEILGMVMGAFGIVLFIVAARWETKRRTVRLVYEFEDGQGEFFKKIIDAFNNLALCKDIWALVDSRAIYSSHEAKRNAGASSLVNRTSVQTGEGKPPWVETNIDVPIIKARGQALYLMPDGILVYDNTGVGLINYSELKIESATTRFIEEKPPSDARIVDSTWKHPNKRGGPDRRFSDNYEIPICLYGELRLKSSKGLNLYFQTSKNDAPEKFMFKMLEHESTAKDASSKESPGNIEDEETLRKGIIVDTEEGSVFRKMVIKDKDVKTHVMPIICPFCSENFETEVDLSKAQKAGVNIPVKINAKCPYCRETVVGDVTMQAPSWRCEYCGEKFPTKEEAEKHEETCETKKE